jgi:hypothetical protein
MKTLQDSEKIKDTHKFYEKFHQIEMDYKDYWLEHTLWHWEFWLSISLTIVPWILWFIFRKRGSEARLLLAGLFVICIASFLDFIGVASGLWHYSGKALPLIPTYMPWDFSLLPVTMMLWIQAKRHWNPFIKGFIYACLAAFVGEPLFEWIGLYQPTHWRSFYSFPIYIVLYLISHRISNSKTFDPL